MCIELTHHSGRGLTTLPEKKPAHVNIYTHVSIKKKTNKNLKLAFFSYKAIYPEGYKHQTILEHKIKFLYL